VIQAVVTSLPDDPPTGGGWGDLLTTQVLYVVLAVPFLIWWAILGRKRKPTRRDEYDAWRDSSGIDRFD
jgi:hypothetical protein